MSSDLIEVLNLLGNLSVEELLTVQETITKDVQQKIHSSSPSRSGDNAAAHQIVMPGIYTPNNEEIEAELAGIFTPEELAEMDGMDLNSLQLPPDAKTSAQLISEDREDR